MGALFAMQPAQPAHIQADRHCSGQRNRLQGIRVCLLCSQVEKSYTISHCVGLFVLPSICQEPHTVNRQQIATTRAGLFRMLSRCRRWRDAQPDNAAQSSTARRKHDATDPCSKNQRQTAQAMHADANSPRFALYKPCRFALYPPRATHCKSYMQPFQTI